MDYFSELMESYEKLKKRTFKLTYISEAEDKKKKKKEEENQEVKAEAGGAAETALLNILGNAVKGKGEPIKDPTYPGLEAFKMWKGPKGTVVSYRRGQNYVLDQNGGWLNTPGAIQKKEEMLNAMGGGEEAKLSPGQEADKLAQDQADLEEWHRQQRMVTLGSLISEDPERFATMGDQIRDLETKNASVLKELCEKGLLSDIICGTTKKPKDRVRPQYIGGSRKISLESKLVTGTGFISFEDGKMVRQQIGELQIHNAFTTNLELLKEMQRGDPKCEYVRERLGRVGAGDIVLFTNPDGDGDPQKGGDTGGIVLTPNALHNSMLDHFKDCDIKKYEFKGSTNALNETKGRFNEGFMGLITRVYSAVRSFPKGATKKTKQGILKPIIDEFEDDVQDTLASLREFAGTTPMADQAIELESYPLMEEVERELQSLTADGGVKNLISQMLVQMGGLIKRLSADDIIAGGTAQRLGGKVDNFFLYKGDEGLALAQSRARHLNLKPEDVVSKTPKDLYDNATEALKKQIGETLKRQGLSVTSTTEIHLLSAGNKLSVGNQVKFGDLSLGRGLDIAMGTDTSSWDSKSSLPADEVAWYEKLDNSLQFDPSDLGPTGSVATYASSIQAKFKSCDLLSQKASYTDVDGNIVLSKPKQVAQALQRTAQDTFVYGQKDSNFYAACTQLVTNPGTPPPKQVRELRDLTNPDNQKRATESLQRDFLTHQFKMDYDLTGPPPSDWQAKKQGATDCLCRMAGATIMEQTEMGQIVTMEGTDEEPLIVNQNDILRGMGEARRNRTLKIEFSGSTQHFSFEVNGQMITYSTNFERQKGRPAMVGHISKEDAAKVGSRVKALSPKQIQSDTMYQYMVGQMRLLETLINQAKSNQAL